MRPEHRHLGTRDPEGAVDPTPNPTAEEATEQIAEGITLPDFGENRIIRTSFIGVRDQQLIVGDAQWTLTAGRYLEREEETYGEMSTEGYVLLGYSFHNVGGDVLSISPESITLYEEFDSTTVELTPAYGHIGRAPKLSAEDLFSRQYGYQEIAPDEEIEGYIIFDVGIRGEDDDFLLMLDNGDLGTEFDVTDLVIQ